MNVVGMRRTNVMFYIRYRILKRVEVEGFLRFFATAQRHNPMKVRMFCLRRYFTKLGMRMSRIQDVVGCRST